MYVCVFILIYGLTCLHLSFPTCKMNGGTVCIGSLAAQPEASESLLKPTLGRNLLGVPGPSLHPLFPTLRLRIRLGWKEGKKKQGPGSHYKPSGSKAGVPKEGWCLRSGVVIFPGRKEGSRPPNTPREPVGCVSFGPV